jgi:hypothetical protein
MTEEINALLKAADDERTAELARLIANWVKVNCPNMPTADKGPFITSAFLKALGLLIQ